MGITTDCRQGPYNWVAGQRCKPIDQLRVFDNVEPRTGKTLCEVPVSGPKEINRAVSAASEAFKSWSQVRIHRFRNVLFCEMNCGFNFPFGL